MRSKLLDGDLHAEDPNKADRRFKLRREYHTPTKVAPGGDLDLPDEEFGSPGGGIRSSHGSRGENGAGYGWMKPLHHPPRG